MKKNKTFIILAILFLSIGFAAVSATLILNGTINIGTNENDFDVYFSDAYLDGKQDLNIISNDGLSITYETANLSKVGDKSILEYEVTNASTQYDANVSVTCTPSETDLYKVINTIDKEIIEARTTGNGMVTVELKKNVLEEQKINFTCTINSNALERETSNDTALPTADTYILEGTYVDSNGSAISNANLVIYSDTPHYVTTDASGNLLVGNLERGSHEVYYVNDTLDNIKNMTKEEIINKAVTSTNFMTTDSNIVFDNKSSISFDLKSSKKYCSSIKNKEWTFDYTGNEQEFSTICEGEYKIELWGAQGGNGNATYLGGLGSYVSGNIALEANEKYYVYVGGSGKTVTDIGQYGGYNGGGGSSTRNDNVFNMTGTGGGATDIRIESGLKVNDEVHRAYTQNFNSLKTRIMVAAGGGGATALNTKISGEAIAYKNGAAGGGLIGYNGESPYSYGYPKGGTQVAPGAGHNYTTSHGGAFTTAAFGIGGATGWYPWGSGGAGYYGGGSAGGYSGSGASGSSFISGHAGCDAISEISTESKIVHTGQANHYSNLVFTNTVMVDGAGYNWINVKGSQTGMPSHDGDSSMIGNTGNGYAKITYLG